MSGVRQAETDVNVTKENNLGRKNLTNKKIKSKHRLTYKNNNTKQENNENTQQQNDILKRCVLGIVNKNKQIDVEDDEALKTSRAEQVSNRRPSCALAMR